jgi:hypothetical protein
LEEQPIHIGVGERGGFGDAGASFGREAHVGIGLGWPAIAGEAGEGNVEFGAGPGVARMPVEQPLRWVIGIGLGQTIREFLGSNFLPIHAVERDFDQGSVGYFQRLVNPTNRIQVIGRRTKCPYRG